MPEIPNTAVPYQPNQAQKDRAAALRRFNWLFVYTPLTIAGLVVLGLVALMLWQALPSDAPDLRQFTSALADIIIIFTIIPMMLLCAIAPTLAIGWVFYRRQKKKEDSREYGRLQTLFWRIDSFLDKIQHKINDTSPRMTQPLIKANAWLSYLAKMIQQIRNLFKRS